MLYLKGSGRPRAGCRTQETPALFGAGKGEDMQVTVYTAPDTDALLAFLRALPREQRALIFCEDRLTLEAERAVCAGGAAFDVSVTSFARFLGDKGGRQVLSRQGSAMAVGELAAKNADKLRCFGKNPAGCAVRLYETIAQLRAARVTPELLEGARAQAEPLLAEKLADIALVYRAYLAFLEGGGYLDESGVLALLPAALARAGIADTDVYFVGFSSFTSQAAEGIAYACRAARSVTGVFIGGKEALYTNESGQSCVLLAQTDSSGTQAKLVECPVETGLENDSYVAVQPVESGALAEGAQLITVPQSYLGQRGQTVPVSSGFARTGPTEEMFSLGGMLY